MIRIIPEYVCVYIYICNQTCGLEQWFRFYWMEAFKQNIYLISLYFKDQYKISVWVSKKGIVTSRRWLLFQWCISTDVAQQKCQFCRFFLVMAPLQL